MTLPEPPELEQFLAPYPAATQELMRDLRRRLVELLPPCVETLWDGSYAVVLTYGFTEKSKDHFIHMPVYSHHVNLGFAQGASLSDPAGRLEGSGAAIRHVKMTSPEQLEDSAVQGLIAQAWAMAPPGAQPADARTIIRVMQGKRRRPGSV